MKTLLALTIICLSVVSCASRPDMPPKWIDEYGIIHTENPPMGKIQAVTVVRTQGVPNGCVRLRDFIISGTAKEHRIKFHVAKQGGTHADVSYPNGDTFAAVYDCYGTSSVNTVIGKRVRLIKGARAELNRRYIARGEKPKYDGNLPDTYAGLPVREFDDYID